MPAWLLTLLIRMAVTFGIPALVKYVPWIPKEIVEFIAKYIAEMNGEKVVIQNAKVRMAAKKRDAKKCVGSLCATDTKGLG